MEDKKIDNLFKSLQGSFDTENPKAGHQDRFLQKLKASRDLVMVQNGNLGKLNPPKEAGIKENRKKLAWKAWAIAASIALLCALALGLYESQPTLDQQVSEISPEASRTQFYFAGLVEEQIRELQRESTPETEPVIDDTMAQLHILETDYAQLENDLVNGGNSKLILSAMITNFRTRIDLLQEVLLKIENIKNLNSYYDTETTI
ncbi:MAG TPA: hypothetical protein VFM69_07210 [Pricia sp.]|nr:hypothetical protein [Pricia sp.]